MVTKNDYPNNTGNSTDNIDIKEAAVNLAIMAYLGRKNLNPEVWSILQTSFVKNVRERYGDRFGIDYNSISSAILGNVDANSELGKALDSALLKPDPADIELAYHTLRGRSPSKLGAALVAGLAGVGAFLMNYFSNSPDDIKAAYEAVGGVLFGVSIGYLGNTIERFINLSRIDRNYKDGNITVKIERTGRRY